MTLIDQLLRVADQYGQASRLSPSRVSTIIFNDGKILRKLGEGGDITTSRLERALQWLSDNWPEGAEWPDGVPRPAPMQAAS
jgi:hypothetical protein